MHQASPGGNGRARGFEHDRIAEKKIGRAMSISPEGSASVGNSAARILRKRSRFSSTVRLR
jgi:hypothetical protein